MLLGAVSEQKIEQLDISRTTMIQACRPATHRRLSPRRYPMVTNLWQACPAEITAALSAPSLLMLRLDHSLGAISAFCTAMGQQVTNVEVSPTTLR